MNIRYPIYEGVYRILTEERRKREKGTYPAADTATKEDAGLPAYGTGILGGYVPDFCTVRQG